MFNYWGKDSQAHFSSLIQLFSNEKKTTQNFIFFSFTFQHVFYVQVWNPDQPGDINEATVGRLFII
jgi:hypothetical protein